jgi:hypothetical protein
MCRPLPPPLMRTRVLLECPRRRQRAIGPKCARSELPVAAARPSKTARETRLLQQRLDLAFRSYLLRTVTASRRRDSFGAALAGPKVPTP